MRIEVKGRDVEVMHHTWLETTIAIAEKPT